ncbi:MAG: FkbM family methyltransferase [Pseudomonadota bacterium]
MIQPSDPAPSPGVFSTGRVALTLGFLRSLIIYHNPRAQRRWRAFYKSVLEPGALAFDVGAHVGTRSRAMHTAGARVVAIEPQAPFSTFLKKTMPRDITVLPVALGREAAQATLAVSSRHPTVSTLSRDFVEDGKSAPGFGHVRWDGAQEVQVVTLDDLIAQFGPPHYIKIDVEGGEAEVLAGLSHAVPLISVEYLPAFPTLSQRLVDLLADAGNDRFNVVRGESGRFLWPDWRDRTATKSWLAAESQDATSGDLFARRLP